MKKQALITHWSMFMSKPLWQAETAICKKNANIAASWQSQVTFSEAAWVDKRGEKKATEKI